MAQKDMRVRLSAEGQADIIKAFRSVQTEAGKTKQSAQDASKGFDQLKDSARSLAVEFLSYEAAIRVFDGIKGAVENAITFAASMGKLQEKTGLSATTLQVWAAAAKRADISQETVAKGLGLFSKAMGNLQQGSTKASASLKILLGSADALKGLTADEKLRKITDGLAKMSAGSQRAKITTDLFGKAGLELLPVIDQLGGQGFDKLRDKLQAFGALLSDDAIQQAKVAEETFGDLKLATQGVALQFTEGMLPALTSLAGGLVSLAGDAQGGGSAIKQLGSDVGETTKKMIYGFAMAMVHTREYLDFLVADMRTAGQLLDSWHPFRDFKKIMDGNKAATHQAVSDYKQEVQALVDIQNAGDKAASTEENAAKLKAAMKDTEVLSAAQIAAAERLAKARLELKKATAQAELQVDQETNRQAVAFETERWKAGKESATDYYAARHRLAAQMATEEADQIELQIKAEQSALRAEKDPTKKLDIQRSLIELQARATVQRLKGQAEENLLVAEEAAERKKLQTEQLTFEDKLLTAQGNAHQVELNAIRTEAEKYRTELLQAGDKDVDAKVDAFTKALTAEADFKEAQKQLLDTMRLIQDARAEIDDKFERGAINGKERSKELADLDKARLPLLNEQYKILAQIADLSGLKPLIADAEQAGVKVDDLNAKLLRVRSTTKDAGVVFEKSLGKDLGEFLTKGIASAHSIGDAFRQLASNITQDFTKMMEKIIMEKLKAQLSGGGAAGGGGGFLGFLGGMFGGAPGKAFGGEIYGPGTGTSDSVPIWASRGEFVVRSAAVAQPGVRELLHTINQGLRTPPLAAARGPRFAMGGEVSSGFVLGGGNKNPNASLTVGLDYGLLLKNIDAHPDFGRIVVRHAADNRKAMNSALGK